MRLVAGAVFASILATPGAAQVTTLDEGTFTLYVNGARVGLEQFTIQRRSDAGGVRIVAYATITIGDRRIVPSLTTDTSGKPLSYKVEVRDVDRIVTRAEGVAAGNRFSQRAMSELGPSERDVTLTGAVVLDDEVVHQYYFIGRRAGGTVRALAPRRLGMEVVTVAADSAGDVEIGNGTLPSRHLTVTSAGGTVTEVWIDAAGRVLRVAVPSRGLIAVRDEPPR